MAIFQQIRIRIIYMKDINVITFSSVIYDSIEKLKNLNYAVDD